MPRKVFTAGEILTAANLNDVSDQTVMVFDDATARTTAIPTPVEGMVTYLKDTDAVEKFDGSAFVNVNTDSGKILQVLETQKTTSFTTTSSSLVSVTDLEVTITPTSNSSKFLIFLHGLEVQNNGSLNQKYMGIARDTTDIGQESAAQNTTANARDNVNVMVLDSPATASAITYRGRARTTAGILTVAKSSITVMEVAV